MLIQLKKTQNIHIAQFQFHSLKIIHQFVYAIDHRKFDHEIGAHTCIVIYGRESMICSHFENDSDPVK